MQLVISIPFNSHKQLGHYEKSCLSWSIPKNYFIAPYKTVAAAAHTVIIWFINTEKYTISNFAF
jgi:hypothetical protein